MTVPFPEDLLTRYSRTDRAVIAAVSEMVANGVSARKIARVAEAMGVGRTGLGYEGLELGFALALRGAVSRRGIAFSSQGLRVR